MSAANWTTCLAASADDGPVPGQPVLRAPAQPLVGGRIGSYLVTKRLGVGGVGEVFKAVDVMLKRDVAIKVLRDELAADPIFLERFRHEAQLHAKLSHPNVAGVFAFLHEGDKQFMVMEFVAGVCLDEFVRSGGPVPVERALGIFRRALDGIAHAHDCGIVHRDIKPANIMLADNGQVKVMDFGIARAMDSQEHLTRHGQVVGTAKAMAPEQIRGAQADVRSDIYSLGIVLYTMLAGRAPFDGDNDHALMIAQLQQAPAPLRGRVADLSPALEDAVMRALQKDPAARFQSVREFARAIDACLADAAAALPPVPDRFDEPTTSRTVINPVVHGIERLPSPAKKRARLARPRWLTTGVAAGAPALAALVASSVLLLADHAPAEGVRVMPPVAMAAQSGAASAAMAVVQAVLPTPDLAGEPAHPTPAPDAQTVEPHDVELLPARAAPAPAIEGAVPRAALAILHEPTGGAIDDAQIDAALAAGDGGAIQRYRAGERIRLRVATSADAHVYCYLQDESRQILRIYPNRFSPDSRVVAGRPLAIPGHMRFELVVNRKKALETVACFAAERDVIAELPAAVVGREFEPLPVESLDEVGRAFARVAPERVAQAHFRMQPR